MSSLILKTSPSQSLKKRLIIIISRTAAKKANQRNLIKRRIRAIMRPIIKKEKHAFTVIVKSKGSIPTHQTLKNELEEVFNKLKL